MNEALWYEKLSDKNVKCGLCNHFCKIPPDKTGICSVRLNKDGKLYSLVKNKIVAQHIDPIEKKPLFHFMPGSRSYSIATMGCNMKCLHCQNYQIAQPANNNILGNEITPEEIVEEAKESRCQSISYTYTEPTVFFETVKETAKLATENNIKNCLVTNGFMATKPLQDIAPYIDAANVDLKSFSNKFYIEICGAKLEPVLENIRLMVELGIWVEVTTLLIPTLNDSEEEGIKIAKFLADLNPDIPWHISKFYPTNKMLDKPFTPIKTIRLFRKIGQNVGLKYIYSGNVPGDPGESTYCPKCNQIVIERFGYTIQKIRVKEGRCLLCNTPIPGVWR